MNDTLVLGYTHHEVVGMFQTIKPGQRVRLEVCRGYPLPFDPDDPNTNIVTSYANLSLPAMPASPGSVKSTQSYPERLSNHVNPIPHSASNDLETASRSSHHSGEHDRHPANHIKSMPDLSPQTSRDSEPKFLTFGVDLKSGLELPNDRGSISSDQTSDSQSQTSNQGEIHSITFVKGNQGFGFTVADSPYGQKVGIMDRQPPV